MKEYKMQGTPPAHVPVKTDSPILLEGIHSKEPEPMPINYPEDQQIGYAVIGLGHLTLGEILPALKECKKSKIAALVSGHPEKLKKTGLMYNVPESSQYSYENFDEIANNDDVNAVFIVLPNSMHKEFTIRSAKAGKHVLCEKPMAISSDECREMIEACEAASVKLMIAYRIQYEPFNTYVKNQIKEKAIGTVKFVEAQNGQSSGNPDHWRYKKSLSGGGALPDIGIYCLNTTRFILDAEPEEVFAYQYSNPKDPHFKEIDEMVNWQMKFPGGVVAQCSTSYQIHTSKRYRVVGDEGWLNLDNAYGYVGQKLLHGKPEEHTPVQEISIKHVNQFAQEMDYFSDCILNDTQPYTSGEVGLQDQIIIEAIYESAKTGKAVSLKGKLQKNLNRGKTPSI